MRRTADPLLPERMSPQGHLKRTRLTSQSTNQF